MVPLTQRAGGEKFMQCILRDAKDFSNVQIFENLKKAATIVQVSSGTEYRTSDEDQSELLRRIHAESNHHLQRLVSGGDRRA